MDLGDLIQSTRLKLANRVAPDIFYLANPVYRDTDIQPVTASEGLAYLLRTGKLPANGKLSAVASAGGPKAYWTHGFLLELTKHVEVDNFVTASAPAFHALKDEFPSEREFDEFVLDIPRLLPEKQIQIALKAIHQIANFVSLGHYGSAFERIGKLLNLSQAEWEEINGAMVRNPKGFVDISPLEEELKRIVPDKTIRQKPNFTMLALDYTSGKLVALGRDTPDMPLYKAILACIAIPLVMPFQKINSHILGDAGTVYYLPLLKEYVPRKTSTVVAVDLNYNWRNGYKGLPFFAENTAQDDHLRNEILTDRNIKDFTPVPASELQERADYVKQRLVFRAPAIIGVPAYAINIDMETRRHLSELGKKDARELVAKFRAPIWHIPPTFQYAT